MSKNKAREFWWAKNMNDLTFRQYYNRLTELSISMFDWQGLPDSVDPRFLELVLFSNGVAVFFRDDVMGELALMTAISGKWDVYNIPTQRRAYATNGYHMELDDTNSVLIYNNMIHTPSKLDVEMFSRRLAELDRVVDVNARAQKTPILLRCDERERLTLLNLYQQYDGNEPFIYGSKAINANALESINTGAPYIADKIYMLKTEIWNEALTYLGISNINVQKHERMIKDEVTRNLGGVIASRYSRLESRRQACDKINKMFGLNITCDYREDFQAPVALNPTIDDGQGTDTTGNDGGGSNE